MITEMRQKHPIQRKGGVASKIPAIAIDNYIDIVAPHQT